MENPLLVSNESGLQTIRIAVVGDSGVGKSTIIRKLCSTKPVPTTLLDFGVNIETAYFLHGTSPQRLFFIEFIDFPGHKRYRDSRQSVFKNIDAVIFVFDARNKRSRITTTEWIEELLEVKNKRNCFNIILPSSSSHQLQQQQPLGMYSSSFHLFTQGESNLNIPFFCIGTVVNHLPPLDFAWINELNFSDLVYIDISDVVNFTCSTAPDQRHGSSSHHIVQEPHADLLLRESDNDIRSTQLLGDDNEVNPLLPNANERHILPFHDGMTAVPANASQITTGVLAYPYAPSEFHKQRNMKQPQSHDDGSDQQQQQQQQQPPFLQLQQALSMFIYHVINLRKSQYSITQHQRQHHHHQPFAITPQSHQSTHMFPSPSFHTSQPGGYNQRGHYNQPPPSSHQDLSTTQPQYSQTQPPYSQQQQQQQHYHTGAESSPPLMVYREPSQYQQPSSHQHSYGGHAQHPLSSGDPRGIAVRPTPHNHIPELFNIDDIQTVPFSAHPDATRNK